MSRTSKKVIVNGPLELRTYLDSPGEEDVKRQIRDMFEILRGDPAAGEHVRKKLWPDKYVRQGINNLFRYRIGAQLRFAYTIVDVDPNTRMVKILDFFRTHKEYERVFGYD